MEDPSYFLYRFICSKKIRLKIIQGTYSWYPLPHSLSIFPFFSSDAIVPQGKSKFLSTIPTQLWNDSPLSPLTYRRPLIRQPHLNSSDFRALLDDAEGPTSEDQLNNQLSRPAAATARKPLDPLQDCHAAQAHHASCLRRFRQTVFASSAILPAGCLYGWVVPCCYVLLGAMNYRKFSG